MRRVAIGLMPLLGAALLASVMTLPSVVHAEPVEAEPVVRVEVVGDVPPQGVHGQTVRLRVTSTGDQVARPLLRLAPTGVPAGTVVAGAGWECSLTLACALPLGLLPGASADLDVAFPGWRGAIRPAERSVSVLAYPAPGQFGTQVEIPVRYAAPGPADALSVDLGRHPSPTLGSSDTFTAKVSNRSSEPLRGAVLQLTATGGRVGAAPQGTGWACRELTCWSDEVLAPGASTQVSGHLVDMVGPVAFVRADATATSSTGPMHADDLRRYLVSGTGVDLAPELQALVTADRVVKRVLVRNTGARTAQEPTEVALDGPGTPSGVGWACVGPVDSDALRLAFRSPLLSQASQVCRTTAQVEPGGSLPPLDLVQEIGGRPAPAPIDAQVFHPDDPATSDDLARTGVVASRRVAGDIVLQARDVTGPGADTATVSLEVANAGPGVYDGPLVLRPQGPVTAAAPWVCEARGAMCRASVRLEAGQAMPPVLARTAYEPGYALQRTSFTVEARDDTPGNGYAELSLFRGQEVRPVVVAPELARPGESRTWQVGVRNDASVVARGPYVLALSTDFVRELQPGPGWTCEQRTCAYEADLQPGETTPPVAVLQQLAPDAVPGREQLTAYRDDPGQPTSPRGPRATASAPVGGPRSVVDVGVPAVVPQRLGAAATADVVVSGPGELPVPGPVTVRLDPAQVLSVSGVGWSCEALRCTRAAGLEAGEALPAIVARLVVPAAQLQPLGAVADLRAIVDTGNGMTREGAATVPLAPETAPGGPLVAPPNGPAAPSPRPPVAKEDLRLAIAVTPTTTDPDGRLRALLPAELQARLTLRDPTGAPVAGERVHAQWRSSGGVVQDTDAVTSAEGTADSRLVPPADGDYLVVFTVHRDGLTLAGASEYVRAYHAPPPPRLPPGAFPPPPATVIARTLGTSGLRPGSTVTFDRDVVGQAQAVTLQGPNGAWLPVDQTCVSAAYAYVPCTGAFRFVGVTPRTALVPGAAYRLAVQPAPGVSPWAGETFRAALTLQDKDITAYWPTKVSAKAVGGSYRQAKPGAPFTTTFTGSSVRWWYVRGPGLGWVRVTIDGKKVEDHKQLASVLQGRHARTYTGLSAGPHTMTITVLSGQATVDAVSTATSLCTSAAGCSTNPAGSYALPVVARAGASDGRVVTDAGAGSWLHQQFVGTGVDAYVATGPTMGPVELRLDGKRFLTFNAYAARPGYRRLPSPTVRAGAHTLTVVALGKPVAVDGLVIR